MIVGNGGGDTVMSDINQQCPFWVISGPNHPLEMTSALPPKSEHSDTLPEML